MSDCVIIFLMTIDERIEALTQSVELLASMHKDNEVRAEQRAARQSKLERALMLGVAAFMQELTNPEETADGTA
jgi:hypothetical protein